MPVPTHTVACTRKQLIARDAYEIAFAKPAGFTHKAGQFVLWDVPMADKPEDVQTRAYSIASAPSEPELLFLIKLKEGGRGSRFVTEMLEVGTQVVMKGPFGVFTIRPDPERDLLLVGTGTGIAPYRAHLHDLLPKGETRRMDLLLGVRAEEDLFWKEDFEAMARAHPNVFLHFTLSRASEGWKGHRGRVQTLLPMLEKDLPSRTLYLCGNPEMIREIKALCLEKGVPKRQIHSEGFI